MPGEDRPVGRGDRLRGREIARRSSLFAAVVASLVLFVALPLLLRAGRGFWSSLGVSMAATVAACGAMVAALRKLAGA